MQQALLTNHARPNLAEPYVSVCGSAFWAKLWLSCVMLSRVWGIMLNAAEIVIIALWPETASAALLRSQTDIGDWPGGQFQIGVILASGVLLALTLALYGLSVLSFLSWQWKAHGTVSALTGAQRFIAQPVALGAWFVPLVNLVVPYLTIRELWRTSDPEVERGATSATAQPQRFAPARRARVTTWWILFWGMLIARAGAWQASRQASDLGDWVMACWFELSASALTALAAGQAVRMIGEITERQSERYANLQLQQRHRAEAVRQAQGRVIPLFSAAAAPPSAGEGKSNIEH